MIMKSHSYYPFEPSIMIYRPHSRTKSDLRLSDTS